MTIKPEVLAAMDYLHVVITSSHLTGWKANRENWQTIRTELTRLSETADAVDPLVVRLGEVTDTLDRTYALLREATEWNWLDEPVEEMNALAKKIEAHLSGPRI